MRFFVMLLALLVVNVAQVVSVSHDSAAATQQLAFDAGSEQETIALTVPCLVNGSCSSDGTTCASTCASHAAIDTPVLQYGVVRNVTMMDRFFSDPFWRPAGSRLQERPPKTLSV